MKRVLSNALPTPEAPIRLNPEEAHHLVHVLRASSGDIVEVLSGDGKKSLGKVRFEGQTVLIDCHEQASAQLVVAPWPVTLELSVLKGDAMAWAIEKAVELGADEIAPILADHGVVKVHDKGPEAFQSRWQKIADQALKQCGRAKRVVVRAPEKLNPHVDGNETTRLWLDETAFGKSPTLLDWVIANRPKHVSLAIGPEGGWSENERRILSKTSCAVSLGPFVLRAETAAIAALSVCASFWQSESLTKTN